MYKGIYKLASKLLNHNTQKLDVFVALINPKDEKSLKSQQICHIRGEKYVNGY